MNVDQDTQEKYDINECEYMEDTCTKELLDPNLERYQSEDVSDIEGINGEKEMNAHSRLSHANKRLSFDGHEELTVDMTFLSVKDFH